MLRALLPKQRLQGAGGGAAPAYAAPMPSLHCKLPGMMPGPSLPLTSCHHCSSPPAAPSACQPRPPAHPPAACSSSRLSAARRQQGSHCSLLGHQIDGRCSSAWDGWRERHTSDVMQWRDEMRGQSPVHQAGPQRRRALTATWAPLQVPRYTRPYEPEPSRGPSWTWSNTCCLLIRCLDTRIDGGLLTAELAPAGGRWEIRAAWHAGGY